MLRAALLAIALSIPGVLYAGDEPVQTPAMARPLVPACSDYDKRFPSCGLTKAEIKTTRLMYQNAIKLAKKNELEPAFKIMQEVRAISPQDAVYASAEKMIGAKIVSLEMRKGNQAMQRSDATAALTSFRRAAEIDPTNEYAEQRLHDALPAPDEFAAARLTEELADTRLKPAAGVQSFEYRGSSLEFLQQFTKAYGITGVPDEGLTSRPLRSLKLENITWDEGVDIVQRVCKVLVIPMNEHQVLLANDTEENRRDLVPMSLRTFYASGDATPQELTDLVTALRVMFDLRFITLNSKAGTVVVRAPQTTMDAVTKFLDNLQAEGPTVMLDVKIFQISTAFTRDLGASVPNQFSVFNVTSEVNKLVNSSTYSQIVAALQAAGQPVNATTILAALLASASSLGGSSSPLSQPFGTFGGGITLSGVTIPSTSLSFSLNNSMARTVDDVLLRSSRGKAATLKVGERYPIVSTQYGTSSAASTLLSSLGISTGTTAGTQVPSPQFSYEDLGLTLKTTPQVHGKLVSMDYELTIRSLGATQVNGLPLLTNQEMKGTISTEDGETVVIAGMVDKSEMASINGIPLLSSIPRLGNAFSVTTKEKTMDELLVVITPHIGAGGAANGAYILVPTKVPK
jgi:type II secretory pathway component GspD/PulD (secretin)